MIKLQSDLHSRSGVFRELYEKITARYRERTIFAEIMAQDRIGDKSLSKPTMTQFHGAYDIRYSAKTIELIDPLEM